MYNYYINLDIQIVYTDYSLTKEEIKNMLIGNVQRSISQGIFLDDIEGTLDHTVVSVNFENYNYKLKATLNIRTQLRCENSKDEVRSVIEGFADVLARRQGFAEQSNQFETYNSVAEIILKN